MRKLIVSEFVTLDCVMEAPEKWFPPFWSEELQKYKDEEQFDSDTLLLGRNTYEIFAGAWPSRTGRLADNINGTQKIVVSASLRELGWNNSKLIQKSIVEGISRLKQQPGINILTVGSSELVRLLLQNDLVDELRLIITPIILGKGIRLFNESESSKNFNLIESKTFNAGVVLLTYHSK